MSMITDKPGEQTVCIYRLPIVADNFVRLSKLLQKAYGKDLLFRGEGDGWVQIYKRVPPKSTVQKTGGEA